MIKSLFAAALSLGACTLPVAFAQAQSVATPPTPTIASAMDSQLKLLEGQFVPAAEAMPSDKYAFVPE